MGSRYLLDLADVVRSAGLVVQEEPGWETRARGSGGYDSGRPNHVMIHHTASNPSSDGQPDVNYQCYSADARPIANLYLSRTGKVWVMAAGATNTNGSGIDPCGLVANDSMNSAAIGIEAANNGVGEVWADVQQSAYVALVSKLCEHYGIPTSRIHTHHSYAETRKIDPAGPSQWPPINSSQTWSEDAFEASIADALLSPTEEEDAMRILVVDSVASTPAILLVGYVGKWLDPGRYEAFHRVYEITDEHVHHTTLTDVHLLGPCPPDLAPWHFWSP